MKFDLQSAENNGFIGSSGARDITAISAPLDIRKYESFRRLDKSLVYTWISFLETIHRS